MSRAISDVLRERLDQWNRHGHSDAHDDTYVDRDLVRAAALLIAEIERLDRNP